MKKLFSNDLIKRIQSAESVVVLTGAGISAESGIPVFRGKNSEWNGYKPEELSNIDKFIENPELVWEWYRWRRNLINKAEPNQGHFAIAKLEEWLKNSGKKFCLLTQNVDGLHRRAGSDNILELHGNIMKNKCIKCGFSISENDFDSIEIPTCPNCLIPLKPGVVSFGEKMPEEEIRKAFEVSKKCDLFIYIGTSAVVYPAANLPPEAKKAGAFIVEINQEKTNLSDIADELILGKAGVVLPEIVDNLNLLIDQDTLDVKAREDYTHITVLLDRSGSMETIKDDTIGGFNSYLNSLKTSKESTTLTLVQFDTQDPYEVIHRFKAVEKVGELTTETFVPRSGTPLLDSIGRAINDIDLSLKKLKDGEHPSKVIVVIVTDGQENSSCEFSKKQISKMIKEKTKKDDWQFVFLSADLGGISDARNIGIDGGSTLYFEKSSRGTDSAWSSLAKQTSDYRSSIKKKFGFDDEDRKSH